MCTGCGPGTSTKYREKRIFEADYVTLYYADVDGGSKCDVIDQMSSILEKANDSFLLKKKTQTVTDFWR